jgi:hypothetical protein
MRQVSEATVFTLAQPLAKIFWSRHIPLLLLRI